jgi:CRP-like cAMP-binding protein
LNNLFLFLQSIHPLSDGLIARLREKLQTKEFKKKEFVLYEGQVCNNIYFIESGFFKSFHLKDGKEITQWFMKAGDVIISVSSFYKRQPSYEAIQVMEDAVVHFISYEDLQDIYRNFVEFNFVGRILTEKYYLLSEERLFGMRKQKAEERFYFLLQNHPDILQQASLTDVASYLGISLETLSRIRARR